MTIPTLIRRVGRFAGNAGVTVSLVVFALLALGPRTGAYRTLTVLSSSMRPAIPEGAVVVVTPVALDRVRVGDVLTYRIPVDDRRVVTHRVVEIVERGAHPVIRTKGDASGAPDPWIARLESGPGWRVRASLPYAGHGINALGHPLLRRINVLALPAALAVWTLSSVWTRRPEDDVASPASAPPPTPSPRLGPVPPVLACWGVASPTCGSSR